METEPDGVRRSIQQFNEAGEPLSIPWTRNLVNLWQTPQERRDKYWLARSCGAGSHLARRMADWRLCKIERYYNLTISSNSAVL